MPRVEAVIAEFDRQLQSWAEHYAGRPADEMSRLWLLALEREHLVTVAYRRDVVEARLGRMPISEPVRRAVARAIRWAWRDEEMHALYVRGALLRKGTLPERARAWLTQLEGRVAGWTSSRQVHNRWSEAPVTRVVAELLELAGHASGRVPAEAGKELHFQAFRDWCRFNVAAERTAGMGWARMAELGPAAGCHADDIEAFRRMRDDERRHSRIFELFADSFDADDRLAHTLTDEWLLEELGQVGQRFLSSPRPGDGAWHNPLGKGGTVVVREATADTELTATLHELLDAVGLERLLSERRSDGPLRVAISTSFMLATTRRDRSPAVSPALLHALGAWLAQRGCTVDLIDARNVYDRFYGNRTVHEVARYLGVPCAHYTVVDAQLDQAPQSFLRGLGQDTVCEAWQAADVRITLGKLRGHPTSVAMLSIEALEGLGGRHDDYVWGDRKADRSVATMMILDALHPDLALLDAFTDVPDGLLGMMGRPDARQPLRLYGSTDAVALDAVVARHLGADPARHEMLVSMAFDWFGDPRDHTSVDGPDTPIAGWRLPDHTQRTALLSRLAMPVYTHASGRGTLFLPHVDEDAFPPLADAGPAIDAARRFVRALTDAGAPAPQDELLPIHWERVDGSLVRTARLGQGPPLVLVHGYPETLQIFCRLAPQLAARHQVFAFDWPGQGYSERLGDDASQAGLAAQLARLVEHWGLQRFTLVAQDMGAPPALRYAADHPDRVERVVVMNSLLFGDAATSREIAIMRTSGLQRLAFSWTPDLVYQQCKRTFLPAGADIPASLEADFSGAFQRGEVRRWLSRMCDAYEAAMSEQPAHYWKVQAPVLALWAEHDHHFPLEQAHRLVQLRPQTRLVVVPGGEHWMVWSRASWVAAAIGDFLEGP